MTVEYLPVGIACNLSCEYCYQEGMRDAGNINTPRNWPRAKAQIDKLGQTFAVFGGEPLLAPISHLEEVWEYGFNRFGSNGIQTNGVLITDEHIKLFIKYNVSVGISIDGPGELNGARVKLTSETEQTLTAIKKLCEAQHIPSLIVTIHKKNGTKIEQMLEWFTELVWQGVYYINLHNLEIEKGMPDLAMDEVEEIQTFLSIYEWSKHIKVSIEPFTDITKLLTQVDPNVSCIWNHCDPLTTNAVQGVNADGSRSNCGRTNKDGINWLKGDKPGFERYLLLHQTPQEHGGCQGCKYFAHCKGQCPGTAIDGDWRNKTVHCKLWYSLFSHIENDLRVSGRPVLDPRDKEAKLLHRWANQETHGDVQHADTPHGDNHGDHTDYGVKAIFLEKAPYEQT